MGGGGGHHGAWPPRHPREWGKSFWWLKIELIITGTTSSLSYWFLYRHSLCSFWTGLLSWLSSYPFAPTLFPSCISFFGLPFQCVSSGAYLCFFSVLAVHTLPPAKDPTTYLQPKHCHFRRLSIKASHTDCVQNRTDHLFLWACPSCTTFLDGCPASSLDCELFESRVCFLLLF